jgi:hypothetical protein
MFQIYQYLKRNEALKFFSMAWYNEIIVLECPDFIVSYYIDQNPSSEDNIPSVSRRFPYYLRT